MEFILKVVLSCILILVSCGILCAFSAGPCANGKYKIHEVFAAQVIANQNSTIILSIANIMTWWFLDECVTRT